MKKLEKESIHIWQLDLQKLWSSKYYRYYNLLSSEEIKRAKEFKLKHLRDNYILSRIILRKLLSSYTNTSPEQIIFYRNEFGKPYVSLDEKVKFNISHSENILVIAIALCEIGIDIEYINPNFNICEDFLHMTLSEREIANVKMLSGFLQKKLFYSYWTQKESLLKAAGTGLVNDTNKLKINNIYNHYCGKKWIIEKINFFDKSYICHIAHDFIKKSNSNIRIFYL